LNYASTISHGGGTVLASSSYFSYLDLNLNGIHEINEPTGKMDVAVVYNVGRGRVVIISDSDILINSMINQGGNLILIKSLIPSDRRAYVLRDFISIGVYTILRATISSIYSLIFYSSIKYPFIALILIASYHIGKATHRWVNSMLMVKHKYRDIDNVVKKHPGWSIEILKKIAEEVDKSGFNE